MIRPLVTFNEMSRCAQGIVLTEGHRLTPRGRDELTSLAHRLSRLAADEPWAALIEAQERKACIALRGRRA